FYVQAWYYKLRKQPLFDDVFTRWTYGPVIPSIYHEFKGYGGVEIKAPGTTVVPRPTQENPLAFEVVAPETNWNDQDAIICM
ncbi:Panacea domain-containing protein, partial [Pseudomonas aeruginosa]